MRTPKVAAAVLAVFLMGACAQQRSSLPATPSASGKITPIETEYLPDIEGFLPVAEARTDATSTDAISDGTYLVAINRDFRKGTTKLTAVVSQNALSGEKQSRGEQVHTKRDAETNEEKHTQDPTKTNNGEGSSSSESPENGGKEWTVEGTPGSNSSQVQSSLPSAPSETSVPSSMASASPTGDTSSIQAGKGSRILWSTTVNELLECEGPSPIICHSSLQSQGENKTDKSYVVHVQTGEIEDLRLGRPGTFVTVGVHGSVAYFLTWNGTRDVHLTGFDKDGAPVVDRNLRIPSNAVKGIHGQISGDYIAVYAEKSSGIYSMKTDVYAETSLTGPCLGVKDGVVCENENRLVGIGVSGQWSVTTSMGVIANKYGASVNLNEVLKVVENYDDSSRDEGKKSPASSDGVSQESTPYNPVRTGRGSSLEGERYFPTGEISDVGGKSGEKPYLAVVPEGVSIVRVAPGSLTLPSGAKLTLETGMTFIALDISRPVGVAHVRYSERKSSDTSSEKVTSTLLFSADGTSRYKNEVDVLAQREKMLQTGKSPVVSSARWQGNTLVFYEDVDVAVVGVYFVADA